MSNPIVNVYDFLQAAQQTVKDFNPRQMALYTALQCEELAEKMEVLFHPQDPWVTALNEMSASLKAGKYDQVFEKLDPALRTDILDADLDLAWVSFGAAMSSGADVFGAWNEVAGSNLGKVNPETGVMDRDANGKVVKPAGWRPPDLAQFVR